MKKKILGSKNIIIKINYAIYEIKSSMDITEEEIRKFVDQIKKAHRKKKKRKISHIKEQKSNLYWVFQQ